MSIDELAGNPDIWLEARNRLSLLSKRELEVLELIALGLSSKQIAAKWRISSVTVDIHRGNLIGKMGVRSMGEAVRIAVHGALGSSPVLLGK